MFMGSSLICEFVCVWGHHPECIRSLEQHVVSIGSQVDLEIEAVDDRCVYGGLKTPIMLL